jgi:hypothetical protein
MTPAEIGFAIKLGALLFDAIERSIAAGQASETERAALLDQFEATLTTRVERVQALRPITLNP